MKKVIKLRGKNKLDIRKQVHQIEERGILVKKCVEVDEHKLFIDMWFEVEEQWGELRQINIENKSNVIKVISNILDIPQKDLFNTFNKAEKENYFRSDKLDARVKLIATFIF